MFKSIEFPRNCKSVIRRYVRDIISTNTSSGLDYNKVNRVECLICWERPKAGYVKLNTDGSSQSTRGQAGAGWLLRDEERRWLMGFMANMHDCDSLASEIWAAIFNLQMAWDTGHRKVVMEMDSLVLVNMLKDHWQHSRFVPMLLKIT